MCAGTFLHIHGMHGMVVLLMMMTMMMMMMMMMTVKDVMEGCVDGWIRSDLWVVGVGVCKI